MSKFKFVDDSAPEIRKRLVSLSDGVRANALRHLINATRYIALGNVDFAMGSLRKERRNFEKAGEIDNLLAGCSDDR